MIKNTYTTLDYPFNFNKKIDDLLLKKTNFNYQVIDRDTHADTESKKTITTNSTTHPNNLDLISRTVDIKEKKIPKGFNYLMNNCIHEEKYEEPENTKYDRLLFSRDSYSSSGGKDDENIDAMIESIKREIANYDNMIGKKRKNTMILYTTIFRSYNSYDNSINEQDFLDSEYEKLNVKNFLTDCNKQLEELNCIDTIFETDKFLDLIKSKI